MKYTAAVIASIAVAQAAPVDQVCKVVTSVEYGKATWVPNSAAPTWSAWSSAKTPEAEKTTTSANTWSAWSSAKTPDAKTTTSAENTWSAWSSAKTPDASKTKTTSAEETWTAWTSTSSSTKKTPEASSTTYSEWASWSSTTSAYVKPTTTSAYVKPTTTTWSEKMTTTTKSEEKTTTTTVEKKTTTTEMTTTMATTTASTTTSAAATTTTSAAPQNTCPAYPTVSTNTVSDGTCDYEMYCNQAVDQNLIASMRAAGTLKFWETTPGVQHNSVAECQALCDADSACNAVIYTEAAIAESRVNDYKRCWLTDNLPKPSGTGYGELSYKVAGSCSK